MIISASRRTDIPALYSDWLRRRLDAGFCTVPNPFNPKQVATISLCPEDVEAIVFWTRHPRPLFALWPRLEPYRCTFQYTITGYGRPMERRTPPVPIAVRTFQALAARLPLGAVIWRYDPIIMGPAFPTEHHLSTFTEIARGLAGHCERVVISMVHVYRKTARRLGVLFDWGTEIEREPARASVIELLRGLVAIAAEHGIAVEACAQAEDYTSLGIAPAKCIDDRLLSRLFGGDWSSLKDKGQRPACRCIPSKDIGMVDSCSFGCAYCYTTRSDAEARRCRRAHDPCSPSLLGWHEPSEPKQLPLFAGPGSKGRG